MLRLPEERGEHRSPLPGLQREAGGLGLPQPCEPALFLRLGEGPQAEGARRRPLPPGRHRHVPQRGEGEPGQQPIIHLRDHSGCAGFLEGVGRRPIT